MVRINGVETRKDEVLAIIVRHLKCSHVVSEDLNEVRAAYGIANQIERLGEIKPQFAQELINLLELEL